MSNKEINNLEVVHDIITWCSDEEYTGMYCDDPEEDEGLTVDPDKEEVPSEKG